MTDPRKLADEISTLSRSVCADVVLILLTALGKVQQSDNAFGSYDVAKEALENVENLMRRGHGD